MRMRVRVRLIYSDTRTYASAAEQSRRPSHALPAGVPPRAGGSRRSAPKRCAVFAGTRRTRRATSRSISSARPTCSSRPSSDPPRYECARAHTCARKRARTRTHTHTRTRVHTRIHARTPAPTDARAHGLSHIRSTRPSRAHRAALRCRWSRRRRSTAAWRPRRCGCRRGSGSSSRPAQSSPEVPSCISCDPARRRRRVRVRAGVRLP